MGLSADRGGNYRAARSLRGGRHQRTATLRFSVRSTFGIAGAPLTQHHDSVVAEGRSFSPGYLHAMHIPLLAGRTFTDRDGAPNAPAVTIVNQAFAARYFPWKSAVGQRLVIALGVKQDVLGSTETIDVIGDVRGTGGPLSQSPGPEVYGPENGSWPHPQFAIRSTLPKSVLEPAVRRIVLGLNGSATVGRFTPLATTFAEPVRSKRLSMAELLSCMTSFAPFTRTSTPAASRMPVVVPPHLCISHENCSRFR